ncbi:MAG: carboxypeptidase-like regulatory domain-containing protein [Bryobacterales bacterium]
MASRLPKISLTLLIAVLLTGALASQSAVAQVLYGSLTGVVSDPSGASIPGAELEATQTLTGRVLKTSDAEGHIRSSTPPRAARHQGRPTVFARSQQGVAGCR